MSSTPGRKLNLYALTWRLPIIFWQFIFFVGPVLFMVAMSFFLVKNYRMTEAFEFVNWSKMLSRGYFWDSYWYTVFIAGISTICAMCIAFPAMFPLSPSHVVVSRVPRSDCDSKAFGLPENPWPRSECRVIS